MRRRRVFLCRRLQFWDLLAGASNRQASHRHQQRRTADELAGVGEQRSPLLLLVYDICALNSVWMGQNRTKKERQQMFTERLATMHEARLEKREGGRM